MICGSIAHHGSPSPGTAGISACLRLRLLKSRSSGSCMVVPSSSREAASGISSSEGVWFTMLTPQAYMDAELLRSSRNASQDVEMSFHKGMIPHTALDKTNRKWFLPLFLFLRVVKFLSLSLPA